MPRVSCKIIEAPLTLQETRSIYDSMNLPKIEFIPQLTSISSFFVMTLIHSILQNAGALMLYSVYHMPFKLL